jgi:DNA-binding NarL/FixJ family response regulator
MITKPEIEIMGVEQLGFYVAPGVIEGIGEAALKPVGLSRKFTPIEFSVLQHTMVGRSVVETAHSIHFGPEKVKSDRRAALSILGAINSAHLPRRAINTGMFIYPELNLLNIMRAKIFRAQLGRAETNVLELVSQGFSHSEIAELRGTSLETVRRQASIILWKMNAKNRVDAARKGFIFGMLQPTAERQQATDS